MVHFFELTSNRGSAVLGFLLSHPTGEYSAADLQKKTKMAKNTLFCALKALERERLLAKKMVGRSKLYSLKRHDAAVKEMKKLENILEARALLARLEGASAYLYGSAAKGEDTEGSDMDLLVIGPESMRNSKALDLPKRASVAFFTPIDYAMLRRKDREFYERVEASKVQVL